MHSDVEEALVAWWTAEKRVVDALWAGFTGDRRKDLHAEITREAAAAKKALYDKIEQHYGSSNLYKPKDHVVAYEEIPPEDEPPPPIYA